MSFWRVLGVPWFSFALLTASLWGQLVQTQAGRTSSATAPTAPADDAQPAVGAPATGASAGKPKPIDDESKYALLPGENPDNRLGVPFMKHLATDQRAFWTAPVHFRIHDLEWIAPFTGVTAGFIAGDSWISKQIPSGEIARSKKISNYGVYSLVGAGAGSFVLGHLTGNDRMSETGLLSGEAAIDSTAIAYLLKNLTRRPRPFEGNGHGRFFQGGDSFPSEHAAIAWSVASIMAHEYPGTLTKVLAYGLATGVSATRVTGQQHFTSDVIIGGALGWYFGRQVYRAHHDTSLGGGAWGDVLPESSGEKTRSPENMGSPYVPLDSWIYPAIERLAALGYVKTAYLGIRPWTRLECARMLDEMEQRAADEDQSPEIAGIYSQLSKELADESERINGAGSVSASLDSIYLRAVSLSGPPLRDGYHFGQTLINDYGRPYGEGFNSTDGISAHGEAGPFAFYIQGEYQHSPAIASQPSNVLAAIANADLTMPFANGRREINRLDLLEGSVSLTFHNTQLSFGKQSQWLGVGDSGALLMSNNAEPVVMLKLDSVSPYRVPLLSKVLGPVRTEYFLGQLSGQQFEVNGNQLLGPGGIRPQPFLDGAKFSFKPTANLEIGMGFTAQFAGPGLPFTLHNFLRTFYSHSAGANNPGKRLSELDFSYRVPGIENWLTLYNDSLVVDEFSPLGSTRASINPGIYMPQIPKVPKLELRAEGLHEPLTSEFIPGFVYYGQRRFRSGYTNDGVLMGNWIGRAGRGGQGWLTYSLSPRTCIQFGYRQQEVSKDFIGGGRAVDYSARGKVMMSPYVEFSGGLQYERWRFPVLSYTGQSDVTASFQFTLLPKWHVRR